MPKVLVIADDLTGALDVAAQFAEQRITAHVSFSAEVDLRGLFQQADVVSINAATRHLDPAAAGKIVQRLAREGTSAGVDFLHKKTDSTLRGNLGAELDALRLAGGAGCLAFVPASPQLGRTTKNGFQFVHGIPLHETGYARDPRSPVSESFIPRLLARQTSAPAVVVSRAELRAAGEDFFAREAIYIFDSETDAEVNEVAAVLKARRLFRATAGPARLMRSVPALFEFARNAPPLQAAPGPLFAVVGSVNEVSLHQSDHAAARGFTSFAASAAALVDAGAAGNAERNRLAAALAQALRRNCPVLLRSARTEADVAAAIATAEKLGLTGDAIFERVAAGLAAIVRQVLGEARPAALAVFGGDTLAAVSHELGWSGFSPRGEWLPGVVGAEAAGGLHVISKPGGFGGEEVLDHIRSRLAAPELLSTRR